MQKYFFLSLLQYVYLFYLQKQKHVFNIQIYLDILCKYILYI